MKHYLEEVNDIGMTFTWLSRNSNPLLDNVLPQMKSFSVVGEMLFTPEEIDLFKKKCGEVFQKHFTKLFYTNEYSFILIGLAKNYEKRSEKIFNYFKVWKKLEKQIDIHGLTSRRDASKLVNNEVCYIGISEFDLDFLPTVIKIVSEDPSQYSILFKKKSNCYSNNQLMNILLEYGISDDFKLDFPNLVPLLCLNHYGVCVWKSASEEQELSCFYLVKDDLS